MALRNDVVRMRRISKVLIIIGILVAVSPLVGQWYTKYQEDRLIDEWLDSGNVGTDEVQGTLRSDDALAELKDTFLNDAGSATEASTAGVYEIEATATPEAAKKPEVRQLVLGVIRIDKIKVKAPIVEGVKAENLRVGVGHIPGTAAIGQAGNCALAGHRSYTFGKFFNRLDELVVGDEFVINTKKEDLRYRIYEKLVVTPDEVSVLKGSRDKSIVTLITCTPIYVASHRLVLHAELEEQVPRQP